MNKHLQHLLQRMADNLAHLLMSCTRKRKWIHATMTMHDKELGHSGHGHEQVSTRSLTCPRLPRGHDNHAKNDQFRNQMAQCML